MNRIVLIGNGFDLAHGLKTSYKNFIDWYWKDWGEKLLHGLNKTETDGLCSFKIKDNVEVLNWASVFKGWYYRLFNKNEKLAKKRISICNNCNSKEHIEIIGDICN